MKILVTGNMGYVGSVLTRYIASNFPHYKIIGFDTGYFSNCLTGGSTLPENALSAQIFGDIRDIDESMLLGIDSVVHLAAISNDPMGKEFADVTMAINEKASLILAKRAAHAGVKNFVFASSCSIYGESASGKRSEVDDPNPLSNYAKSKVNVETKLQSTDLLNMIVTNLRFATACGWSERLRIDLVLNDFVASALAKRRIDILSDGTPWRPLIDVEDMARAICWAVMRKIENGGKNLRLNTGADHFNYRVIDLANAVAKKVDGTEINIREGAQPDKRSYEVDFSLYRSLAPQFQPLINLSESIDRLIKGLSGSNVHLGSTPDSQFVRLNKLREHIKFRRLDKNLTWQ